MTICPDATYQNTCIFVEQVTQSGNTMTWIATSVIKDVGNSVATNSSDAFNILRFGSTGNNLTAVIVPTKNIIPKGMSFRSASYGIGATCEPMYTTCDTDYWIAYGGQLRCTADGSVLTNHTVNFTASRMDAGSSFAMYNLQGSQINVTELTADQSNPTNPFGFAQLMGWADKVTDGSEYFWNSSTFPTEVIWFAGACNVSVYDVELSYSNGSYSLLSRTLSAENTSTMLFLPFVGDYFQNSFAPLIVPNLVSQISNNNTDFLVQVAWQVSELGIGLNAGLFVPTQTISDVNMEKTFLASRYPIYALSLLWASTASYLILGIGVLVRSAGETGAIEPVAELSTLASKSNAYSMPTASTLVLAHQRIVSPAAIVAEHFILSKSDGYRSDIPTPTLSTQKDVMDMFGDERGEGRLGIGFWVGLSPEVNDGLRKRVFGVEYQDQFGARESM